MDLRYSPLFKRLILLWNAVLFRETGQFPGLPPCFGPFDPHPFALEPVDHGPQPVDHVPPQNHGPPQIRKRRGPLFDF